MILNWIRTLILVVGFLIIVWIVIGVLSLIGEVL